MLYEILIIVVVMLCFCFATQILTIKVMISLMNAKKTAENGDFKPIKFMEKAKKPKKPSKEQVERQRKYDTIMDNLEAYDGTGIGQKEV